MSIETRKILSNTERKVKHIWVTDETMAHFKAWKALNGFNNLSDAFEEMVRKLCMNNVTDSNHRLSNGEIAVRPYQPTKA